MLIWDYLVERYGNLLMKKDTIPKTRLICFTRENFLQSIIFKNLLTNVLGDGLEMDIE